MIDATKSQSQMGDPLGGILSQLRVSAAHLAVCDFTAPWGVQFEAYAPAQMFAIAHGEMILTVPSGDVFTAREGDLLMVTRPIAAHMASGPGIPVRPLSEAWARAGLPRWNAGQRTDRVLHFKYGDAGGETMRFFSFVVDVSQNWGQALLGALPPVLLIRREDLNVDWVAPAMQNMLGERVGGGHVAVALRLVELLFIAGLRAFLAEPRAGPSGWLYAVADPQLCEVVSAILLDPGGDWTLHNIAKKAGMSRSALSRRFRMIAGTSPAEFVVSWRMSVAADWLLSTDEPIKVIAQRLRYSTASAFGIAFKQQHGMSPRAFAHR